MKIYFDESGQRGCVLQKEDILNFQKQPTFAVGAVVVRDKVAADKLIEKYNCFKKRFDIIGEIKGSDLLTRAHNDELEYFLKNVLDRYHFFIILYDKRFYISTLLLLSLIGFEYQYLIPEHFYQQATFLSLQKDDFFINYLKYIQNPGIQEFREYLEFLINYEYTYNESSENAVADNAVSILRHAYDKYILHYRNREQWHEKGEWDMKLAARVIRKISVPHIKFTVSLSDWAVSVSTATIFAPKYPKKFRNNFNFNYHYQQNLLRAYQSISEVNRPLDEIMELLNK